MTGGRGRGSPGSSSSNSIRSGDKTRAAETSGVAPVSGVKCGMCVAFLGDSSIGCNSRWYYPAHVSLVLPDSINITTYKGIWL